MEADTPMAKPEAPALRVTHDDDGGLTIHDEANGVVVSLISRAGFLALEPYPYETGKDLAFEEQPGRSRHPWYSLSVR